MDTFSLPTGWQIVQPSHSDLTGVTNFIRACDTAYFGKPDTTESDLDYEWKRTGFVVERDAFLLIDPSGEIAGYTDFYHHGQDVYINHNTHLLPGRADAISPAIFYRMGLERARKVLSPGGRARTISLREETHHLLEGLGFHPIQVQYRMHIDFNQPPEPPSWPKGYQVTAFDRPKHAREVYEVIETAFQELPHREGNSFEGWVHFILERSDFDPSLLFMVTMGEEIAGVAVGFDDPLGGWIRQLAVKRSHRGKQIALNLLRHAFGEFHRRGRTSVGLTVDSENMTGAPQLYLRAGMRQTEKYVTYMHRDLIKAGSHPNGWEPDRSTDDTSVYVFSTEDWTIRG